MARKTILFVAMQNSPHAVRWINQISGREWDVHLFPVYDAPVLPELRNTTVHQPWVVLRLPTIQRMLSRPSLLLKGMGAVETSLNDLNRTIKARSPFPMPQRLSALLEAVRRVSLGESGVTVPAAFGPKPLARVIRRVKPDLIHSLEFQHCGYNVLAARDIVGEGFPPWLATNWGSDIFYYRQFEGHRNTIKRLLEAAAYYSCECQRDAELARELGFRGQVMPVMPNAGGFDLEHVERLRKQSQPSDRKVILVKGYQSFAGRALTALDAIEQCAPALRGFKVLVYSASRETRARVRELRLSTDLNIAVLNQTSHEAMLRMFARARIYLGVGVSDGISTSMLEAMALGTFPIQTNTSCCDEWMKDGLSGFRIPADDVPSIADRIRRAATDDALVNQAAELNWQTVQARLDEKMLRQQAVGFYESIFGAAGP